MQAGEPFDRKLDERDIDDPDHCEDGACAGALLARGQSCAQSHVAKIKKQHDQHGHHAGVIPFPPCPPCRLTPKGAGRKAQYRVSSP